MVKVKVTKELGILKWHKLIDGVYSLTVIMAQPMKWLVDNELERTEGKGHSTI